MATKRVNPNRIKTHFSYNARELADLLDVHKNTILNWTRGGMPALATRPALYHGGSVRAFLAASNASRKRPCPPGMLYCFRCRDHRRPALGMVDFFDQSGRAGNLTALCETCGATMNRRARREAVAAVMPGLDVQFRQAAPRLKGAHDALPELRRSMRRDVTKPNAENERIKREYFRYLREAGGRDAATIDGVAKSLARFEATTKARNFRQFHREQAVAFKRELLEAINLRTGERLSKATMLSALRDLRAFFIWLAREPGYKSHIAYSDSDYFNLADKDVTVARARREPNPPTPDQMRRVLDAMPAATLLERRDRAVVAFACLTASRVRALTTMPLGAVNLSLGIVEYDARVVRTKGAKTFQGDFHSVVPGAADMVADWCAELARDHGWGPADPLFSQNDMGLADDGGFAAVGLARKGWATSEPVRAIFKRGFAAAGLPYFNPHSLRAMLVRHYMAMNLTPAEMKAVSQSLGHSQVMTTFSSYGQVPAHRQSELIRSIAAKQAPGTAGDWDALEAVITRLRAAN